MASIHHHHRPLLPVPSRRSPLLLRSSKLQCNQTNTQNDTSSSPFQENKSGFVDYDKGLHEVSTQVTGLRKAEIPRRYRLRVQSYRFQKDLTVSQVVEKVLQINHFDDVVGLLNHWVGRFARKNFPHLIKELTERGSLEHCLVVFRWMKDQKNYCARTDIYNMMIRLHARHNQTDQARGLFFEMQEWRCKPNAETYNALINAHGRAGQWRWAMNIMDDMLRQAVCYWLLLCNVKIPELASCHSEEANFEPGSSYKCSTISTLSILGSTLVTQLAFCTIQEVSNLYHILQIPPSRSTYNNLINACGSSGNWREALKVCKKMTENGVGPDLVTHNIMLTAYKNGAQYSRALSYFELMKGTNIRPDTTTLNIVIYCLVKLGQYDKAVGIFNSMRDKRAECHPDVVTFTTIIHLYAVSGQVDNCTAVFSTMVAEGLKPNVVSYNALIGAYASHGMSKEALSVFNEIKRSGFRPDVVSYTSLLNSYGRSQQPKKAREVFQMMKANKCKPNLISYNALIDAYGSNGLFAEAVEILRDMEQNGVQPNVVSICTLLAACGRCGRKVNIDAVLSAAEMRGIKLNTIAYNSAIGSYMSGGEFEKATALYKSMRKRKVRPDTVTYTVLISGCCKMSKYDEALEFVTEMMDLKIPFTKEVYSSAICAFSKQGKIAEAESIFSTMKMVGCCPDVITYTMMLHAYNTAEHWEKACALLQEMDAFNIQPDTIACSALMSAFNKGGESTKVLVLAEFMKEKEIPFSDAVFFEIVCACSLLRDWRKIVDLINLMEPSFSVLSVGLVNQLLHLLGKSGKIEHMMKLFFKIIASGAEINSNTYSILLKNLLGVGNWRKYVEVLEWMNDAGIKPSNGMYLDIITFAQKSAGPEYASIIQERIETLREKSGYEISTNKV